MQYSVEYLRSLRPHYVEPPYPGFSLEEVCRRRLMTQTKLVRGENAWVAKGTAQTTEEWVARLVQGSLNKMSERNFDSMVAKMRTKELFASTDILTNVVNLIFSKALDEPENSKLYAGVCFELAMYEVNLTKEAGKTKGIKSELRNTVIEVAQRVFKSRRDVPSVEKLPEGEEDFARSNFVRRNRANMRFVGELYLRGVISNTAILHIISAIMKGANSGAFPAAEDIELLAELFATVGERLESDQRESMDTQFALLESLIKRPNCPYPPRICFKIMDLLDLRKSSWGSRPKPIKARPAQKDRRTPQLSSPTSRKAAKGFPDTPAATEASKNWRDLASSKSASASPVSVVPSPSTTARVSAPSTKPKVAFDLRLNTMFQEWVSDRTNDFIPRWIEEFNGCDRDFKDAEELCETVAMEIIKSACLTTRKEAQLEAYSFLIVGLNLADLEVFQGFAAALAIAIEDGLLEDVPKFSERFMLMLRFTSAEEVSADVYYDAAHVLSMTYNRLTNVDETSVEALMGFWAKVPPPSPMEEEAVSLGTAVVYSLCEMTDAKAGIEQLLSRIVDSLVMMGVVVEETISELRSLEGSNELCKRMLAAYAELQDSKDM